MEGSRSNRIYEEASVDAKIVGEVPYFGLVFILEEGDGWTYIESGSVRGFIQSDRLSCGSYAQETVELIGEGSFSMAEMDVEIADNQAFTYTHLKHTSAGYFYEGVDFIQEDFVPVDWEAENW